MKAAVCNVQGQRDRLNLAAKRELTEWFATGKIKPRVPARYLLVDTGKAYKQ